MIRVCEVISVDDPNDGGRIKVNMVPEDNALKHLQNFDYAFPLLPKMLHVKPKVGESVIVFTTNEKEGHSQRYYIGPIITQPTHMEEEPYGLDANTMFRGSFKGPDSAPSMNPETKGAFPEHNDISIEGRRNTNIQLTENDVRVKAGVKVSNPNDRRDIKFNTKNPAYMKLKYHEDKMDDNSYKSTATIVADEINLISNNSNTYFETTNNQDLITDKTMDEIIEKAHKLPYGDVLVDFLNLFRDAFLKHTHNFPTMPTCPDQNVVNLTMFDTNQILSNNVRIN